MVALNALDKLDGKAAYAKDRIAKFPTSGGNSPDGRYNGYVGNLLTKTLSDLGIEKPAVKKQRKRQPKKAK